MRGNRSALRDGCVVSEDGGRIAAGSRYRLRDRCRNRFRNRLEASILSCFSLVKGCRNRAPKWCGAARSGAGSVSGVLRLPAVRALAHRPLLTEPVAMRYFGARNCPPRLIRYGHEMWPHIQSLLAPRLEVSLAV